MTCWVISRRDDRVGDRRTRARRVGVWDGVRRAASIAAVLAAAGSAGGCVLGPDFVQPHDPTVSGYLPGGARSGDRAPGIKLVRGGQLPAEWWDMLGSAELNQLIEAGLRQNADLEAAEAAIRVAQANTLALRGGFFPTVQGNWNSSRQLTPTRTLTSNQADGNSIYSLHTAQVTVAYALDVWGGLRRQVEASKAQIEALDMQREAVALTLTSNIAVAAIQQASFEDQITATKRLITSQVEFLEILKRQLSAGQIAMPDVLVQETAVAQARQLLPPLEKQRDQQRNLIAVLTGRLPGDTARQTFRLASFKTPHRVPLSLPADLVRQRPDIRVAEANLHQANAQIGVAMAARFPQIALNGNAGSTADAISRLFSTGTWFWLIAGNAVQTVFDGRTLEMKQKAAEETFNQQTAQYRSVVLTAFQNVADVLLALEADGRAVKAAQEAEAAATRSVELIRKQLQEGQISLPTLLTAQQAQLQTTLSVIQARASRLANTVALYQALGGGWWQRREAIDEAHAEKHKHVAKAEAH